MRAVPNLYSNVDAAIQRSELALQNAVNQLSSGKRVNLPSDDPLAFAQNAQSLSRSADVDRYTKNADAVLAQAQAADSVLSSVVTSLNQVISLGVEGGNAGSGTTERTVLAQQVQSVLDGVVAKANTTVNGVALFAGTASVTTPFVSSPTTPNVTVYQGDSASNQAAIGDGFQVTANLAGDSIFTNSSGNVFGSLQGMISALQTGTPSDIAAATASVSTAIAHIGQVRASYGGTSAEVTAQMSFLSQETVTLSTQQASLTNVDIATAATNLTQAQTADSAVLAMAAKILPQSLLTYLHG